MSTSQLVLVTGATGYVGGRLVPRLLESGYRVRCMVRDLERLKGREWHDKVEIVPGDVMNPETLATALNGVEAAYYLIHGMAQGADFQARDREAARNFSHAAARAQVKRIIYLGGLGDDSQQLSGHLKSRHETGEILREAGVPVTEFRAAIVVGSGSLSFEMIRYLTERLPVMICPKWVASRVQPIAIRNVLDYLVGCLTVPESAGRIIEIGGTNTLTYAEMMQAYAAQRKLTRCLISVPVLTPRLSSYWLRLVTPLPVAIARPLVDGLKNDVVVTDPDPAAAMFPDIKLLGYDESVRLALAKLKAQKVETVWHDSLSTSQRGKSPTVLTTHEGMIVEHRQRDVNASAEAVYSAFTALGGAQGWPSMNWAWRLRGILDSMAGGVGMRRGRRHPQLLRIGDAVDFWRVEALEPNHLMRLRAEMKVPGEAWLQFKVESTGSTTSHLQQTAFFAPRGLTGNLYWYATFPFHGIIFQQMIDRIAATAEKE